MSTYTKSKSFHYKFNKKHTLKKKNHLRKRKLSAFDDVDNGDRTYKMSK